MSSWWSSLSSPISYINQTDHHKIPETEQAVETRDQSLKTQHQFTQTLE
jgi:hypothetical protein